MVMNRMERDKLVDEIRDILLPLPQEERQEVMIASGFCIDCGNDLREMFEHRGFWMCHCANDD